MERNKKSKKSAIAIIFSVVVVILSPFIYEMFVYFFSLMDLGTLWENMYNLELDPSTAGNFLKENFWSWFSLILCRLIIYLFPATIFYLLTLLKKDKIKNKWKFFTKCLNLQFLGYLIYQAFTIVLALDYLIGLEPFANITIYMTIFGYILTIPRNKNIELGKLNDKQL